MPASDVPAETFRDPDKTEVRPDQRIGLAYATKLLPADWGPAAEKSPLHSSAVLVLADRPRAISAGTNTHEQEGRLTGLGARRRFDLYLCKARPAGCRKSAR